MTDLLKALRESLAGEQISDSLGLSLLKGAEDTLLALTNRSALPNQMQSLLVRLAVIRFNFLGLEGESARREGSFSVNIESLPSDILTEIKAWRIGRIGL